MKISVRYLKVNCTVMFHKFVFVTPGRMGLEDFKKGLGPGISCQTAYKCQIQREHGSLVTRNTDVIGMWQSAMCFSSSFTVQLR